MPIRISGSTGISGLDGSATTPVLQGASANSGIYYSGNTVFVSTSGTNALTIGPAGNATFSNTATFSGNVTFSSNNVSIGGQTIAPNLGMKNRIINGNMTVFQRGTAATSTETYSVDRWKLIKSNDASESVSQNSDNPGYGFKYSLRNTVSTADASIGSTQYSGFGHVIEGYNIADLGFGTSYAKPITLSFWFKSPVTGSNFHATILNADGSRICPVTFTVNSADTWEYKTITYPGCTDGTWNTTNGSGIILFIYMAVGSSYAGGTSGVWNSLGQYITSTQANLIGTNGNVIGLTGVQLEVGSIATPFEFRHYENELILCQRYYHQSAAPGESLTGGVGTYTAIFYAWGTYEGNGNNPWPVQMRAAPTVTHYDNAGVAGSVHRAGIGDATGTSAGRITVNGWQLVSKTGGWSAGNCLMCTYKADAEL